MKSTRTLSRKSRSSNSRKVRYAIVGLGHIVQVAVLPAFRSLKQNSELVALVSDSPKKLKDLSRRYRVPITASYDDLEVVLKENEIDAVFIGLPNSLHEQYAVRCLESGVHVLCEKPLADTVDAALRMKAAAEHSGRQLMTAYRLHFEPTYLSAMAAIHKGEVGEVLSFTSHFGMQIKRNNVRLKGELGGGALMDIGIYCINAARSVFREEPRAVIATFQKPDARFDEVDGGVSATLYFSDNKTAQFYAGFAVHDRGWFEVLGTRGVLRMEPAFEYAQALSFSVEGKRTRKLKGKRYDQFAGELDHFSDCIRKGKPVRADAQEGVLDMRVMEAIRRSADSGKVEFVEVDAEGDYANKSDERKFKGKGKPELIGVAAAGQD